MQEVFKLIINQLIKTIKIATGIEISNLSNIDISKLFIQSGNTIGIILGILALVSSIYFGIKETIKKLKKTTKR